MSIPYPKIDFVDHFENSLPPARMIRELLRPFNYRDGVFELLLDYLLYGFGDSLIKSLEHIPREYLEHWSKIFDLRPFLDFPGDWLGNHYEIHEASSSLKSCTGFFTTPPAICKMMVKMAMNEAHLLDTFNEPCLGSGRMLLEASNYCLNLSGNDINKTLVKISKVNCWLYVPSAIMPCLNLKKEKLQ